MPWPLGRRAWAVRWRGWPASRRVRAESEHTFKSVLYDDGELRPGIGAMPTITHDSLRGWLRPSKCPNSSAQSWSSALRCH